MKSITNESQDTKEREEFLNAVAAWADTLLNDTTDKTNGE